MAKETKNMEQVNEVVNEVMEQADEVIDQEYLKMQAKDELMKGIKKKIIFGASIVAGGITIFGFGKLAFTNMQLLKRIGELEQALEAAKNVAAPTMEAAEEVGEFINEASSVL